MLATNCSEKVNAIIAEKLGLDAHILSNQTSFIDDLSVDSLDMVEIVWEIEKKFKISIPDEEIERITTIGDLVNYVDERV